MDLAKSLSGAADAAMTKPGDFRSEECVRIGIIAATMLL